MPNTSTGSSLDDLLLVEARRLTTLAGRTRLIAPAVHLGTVGGQRLCLPLSWPPLAEPDHALAADLLTRALERLDEPARRSAWLTRSGAHVAGDADLAWRAAARTAFARHGVPAARFWVVTRHGWFEVADAGGRTFARLRPDGRPVAAPPTAPDRYEGWPVVV